MSNQSAVPVAPSLANASSMMVASAFGTLGGWMQYLCDTVCSHVSWVGKETWHWIIAVLLVIVLLFKLHHYMFEHKQLAKMTLYRQAMTNFRICSHHIAVLFDSVSNGFNSTLQFMYKFGVASCGWVFSVVMCLMSGPTKSEIDDANTKLPFEAAADAQIEHENTVRGGAREIRQKEYAQLAKHLGKLNGSSVFTNTAGNWLMNQSGVMVGDAYVPSYRFNTSDHYPVWAKFSMEWKPWVGVELLTEAGSGHPMQSIWLEVYDVQGRLVFSGAPAVVYPKESGMYLLRFGYSNGQTKSVKVFVR